MGARRMARSVMLLSDNRNSGVHQAADAASGEPNRHSLRIVVASVSSSASASVLLMIWAAQMALRSTTSEQIRT